MKKYKIKSEFRLWHFFSVLLIVAVMIAGISIVSSWTYAYMAMMNTPSITTIPQLTTTELNEQAILLGTRQKLIEANVFIQVNIPSGYEIGSGTIIHQDSDFYYAITNEHVLDGNNEVINSCQATTYDNITTSFEVVAIDNVKDLALIKFTKENREVINPLRTLNEGIYIDDIVVAIGNPYGNTASVSYGSIHQVTTIRELEIERLVIEHDAPSFTGSSGGALVDLYGNLKGINSWELNGLYYAIPISVINTFLENNL
jgi:S1-C subfamily serine protease